MNPEIKRVREWHLALNRGDVDQMIALLTDDVEVSGPRGVTRGALAVREWFERAKVRMYPTRFFQRDKVIVVEEAAEWRSPETNEVTGNRVVATVFEIHDGRLSRIVRHDDLSTALDAAELSQSDELSLD